MVSDIAFDEVTSGADWPVPKSAYVHIPFCRHRCGYCNFSVISDRDDLIDAVVSAIDRELAVLQQPTIQTLFVGGGTPTHLSLPQLDRLLGLLRQRLQLTSDCEWSVEANPEDITQEKLELLAQHGVNRISLGVQSFQAQKLSVLERGHDGDTAAKAIELAASVIPNVSLDLIFAAPGESVAQWQEDLRRALSLPIRHLSTYTLTFEKGTSFWASRQKGRLSGVSEEDELRMYSAARELAAASGLEHYEVSNFARPSSRCQHNLAYWRGQGWFAAGPGAARFSGGRREVNHRSTTTYLKRSEANANVVAESEAISRSQFGRELAAFGLRLIDGIDLRETFNATGIDIQSLCETAIVRTIEFGFIIQHEHRLKLTEQGILFADTVASEFLST